MNTCKLIFENIIIIMVIGDGINDSPALKQAEIGISMGKNASEIAKEVADMILVNNDFSKILYGICEGRKIYDNL